MRRVFAWCFLFIAHCNTDTFTTDDGGADGAPSDANALDGEKPADTGLADVDAAVPPSSPCVGAEHWLCDDFDRDGSLTGYPYWSSASVTGKATLAMTPPGSPAPPSPPNALVASAGSGEGAYVVAQTGTGHGLRCTFDVRIDEVAQSFTSNLVVLSLYSGSAYYRLQLVGGSPDGFDDYGSLDGGTVFTPMVAHAFPNGQWHHVSLEASLGAGGHAKIAVDGNDVPFASSLDLTSFASPTSMTFQLGAANYTGSTGSWTIAYDNVFCDVP